MICLKNWGGSGEHFRRPAVTWPWTGCELCQQPDNLRLRSLAGGIKGRMRLFPHHRFVLATLAAGGGLGLYALVLRGAINIDLGWGRSLRPLGPLTFKIAAPRHVVFDVISAPYLRKTPRSLEAKLRVFERGQDMVLAAHFTKVRGLTVTTLETVRFQPPERVDFRLVRGPVPHVVEHFLLRDVGGNTELEYGGELGTDLWGLGRAWGARVAGVWEETVNSSLNAMRIEAERRAVATSRRDSGAGERA